MYHLHSRILFQMWYMKIKVHYQGFLFHLQNSEQYLKFWRQFKFCKGTLFWMVLMAITTVSSTWTFPEGSHSSLQCVHMHGHRNAKKKKQLLFFKDEHDFWESQIRGYKVHLLNKRFVFHFSLQIQSCLRVNFEKKSCLGSKIWRQSGQFLFRGWFFFKMANPYIVCNPHFRKGGFDKIWKRAKGWVYMFYC